MDAVGFVDVSLQRYDDDSSLYRAFNDAHLMTVDEIAGGLIGSGKDAEAAVLNRVVGEAYEESIRGAAICIPRLVCLGKKAG